MDLCDLGRARVAIAACGSDVPIGPCSLISPFNFPLNLVAHKIAPAIGRVMRWVLKPASRTPWRTHHRRGAAETGLPKGAFSILPAIVTARSLHRGTTG
jgi:acyl-CoA reductase-like NAD-dependent aldehyde dehydrogenase